MDRNVDFAIINAASISGPFTCVRSVVRQETQPAIKFICQLFDESPSHLECPVGPIRAKPLRFYDTHIFLYPICLIAGRRRSPIRDPCVAVIAKTSDMSSRNYPTSWTKVVQVENNDVLPVDGILESLVESLLREIRLFRSWIGAQLNLCYGGMLFPNRYHYIAFSISAYPLDT